MDWKEPNWWNEYYTLSVNKLLLLHHGCMKFTYLNCRWKHFPCNNTLNYERYVRQHKGSKNNYLPRLKYCKSLQHHNTSKYQLEFFCDCKTPKKQNHCNEHRPLSTDSFSKRGQTSLAFKTTLERLAASLQLLPAWIKAKFTNTHSVITWHVQLRARQNTPDLILK